MGGLKLTSVGYLADRYGFYAPKEQHDEQSMIAVPSTRLVSQETIGK